MPTPASHSTSATSGLPYPIHRLHASDSVSVFLGTVGNVRLPPLRWFGGWVLGGQNVQIDLSEIRAPGNTGSRSVSPEAGVGMI
jgi:hypothetical protein